MAPGTPMALNALILLGLLLFLPCASVALEQPSLDALFAHIREIQQLSNPELEKFNAKGPQDLVASPSGAAVGSAEAPAGSVKAPMDALFAHIREIQQLSNPELEKFNAKGPQDLVASPTGAAVGSADAPAGSVEATEDTEEVELGDDATSNLMGHIYAVQRKALETNEANGSEEVTDGEEEEEEEEKEVEQDGVADPLVQDRVEQLETVLKSLTDNAVDNQEELGAHKMQLSADGAKGDDVMNLLHKYAHEMHQKLYPDGASLPEDDQSHESAVEIDPGQGKDLEDHLQLHEDDHSHDHDNEDGHGHGHGHHHHDHDHGHGHGHHHDHDHDHGHGDAHANVGFSRARDAPSHNHDHSGHRHGHDHGESIKKKKFMLPEEIAEEEDLIHYGFDGQVYSNVEQPRRLRGPDTGVWLRAMGCSLLVSLASLICLMILPCIVSNGKPSERVVNALAAFGAGAMLGDAFLHQLPHAFGNSGSPHSHDAHQHHHDHGHSHSHAHNHDHSAPTGQDHAHSLQDLSIGLAVLGGILLFFIVEKIVRRYEELSSRGGQRALGHTHHHHQKRKERVNKLEVPEKNAAIGDVTALEERESKSLESKSSDLKKRKGGKKKDTAALENETSSAPTQSPQQVEAGCGFVIGYLNLFSDAVHNFTDGMALGSAFLLHGTVGGWSRTLFLLAHELPQEVGDFGILVKSGFSVFEALAFNFLSALVALAGTAVALIFGASSGHSSLIEGFIAGGFIYMSVGGVMPSMHEQGSSFISTLSQLVPLVLGMGVAVVISLAE